MTCITHCSECITHNVCDYSKDLQRKMFNLALVVLDYKEWSIEALQQHAEKKKMMQELTYRQMYCYIEALQQHAEKKKMMQELTYRQMYCYKTK
ncbi:hypothetical protein F8M41_016833 [Gigaspora margarita]|uniref:Uncharacterized protein n=1 Tax=Gigaspora margarita TaxID=4874 RepID=A0A8H4ANW6_GIGMA|nr:hypothetical protein F8M41_016833 [Gigaspora margarita]